MKGSRRLEFEIGPDLGRGGGAAATNCGARLSSREPSGAPPERDRSLARAASAGLVKTSFAGLIARLRLDCLLYADPEANRGASRLERFAMVNDHSPDFWKFVYPERRFLDDTVACGQRYVRVNHATLECRTANPSPAVACLRYFPAQAQHGHGTAGIETDLTEADVLGGRTQELLGRALEKAAREEKPAFIHLRTTCLPELIGDNPAPFIRRVESELGVPVFWTSKTRPTGPAFARWIERRFAEMKFSARRDPRAVLLAGLPSPGAPAAAARATAVELCAGLGLRVVGSVFPDLDLPLTAALRAAGAVVWLNPVGWETVSDAAFLSHGLRVVRTHPPCGLGGTQAWLERIAAVLGLRPGARAFARALRSRAGELDSLRRTCRRWTVALVGDPADLELLTTQGRAFGFSVAALLGEMGFNIRCLVFSEGADRRARCRVGAGTIEFRPFSSAAQLDRELGRGVDLVFSHINHDPRLAAHGLLGFTEAKFELGLDGLLRSGWSLAERCQARPCALYRARAS